MYYDIAPSRGFKTNGAARGANGRFQSRQQQNEQVIETARNGQRVARSNRGVQQTVGDRPQAGKLG
jgi:hypothetical protein